MTTQYDTIWKEDDLTSVTSPTLRLKSTWSSASFYDSSLVNHNITLESLNLDNIRVVFSKHRSVINIWENVCKLRNVVGKHTVARISEKLYRAKWYLNNIWISDGVSSKKNKATIAASTNALIFLTRNKGLNIIPVERILNENILRIGSKTLTVGTSNDFQVISDKVGDILNNFLDNSKIAKLEFSLDTISDEVKDEIHKLARQFKLGHRNEGILPNKKACIWKTSDSLHNLKDVYLNFNDLASIKVNTYFLLHSHSLVLDIFTFLINSNIMIASRKQCVASLFQCCMRWFQVRKLIV